MPIFSATLGSVSHLSFLSHLFTTTTDSSYTPPSFPSLINHSNFSRHCHKYSIKKRNPLHSPKVSLSGTPKTDNSEQTASANAASATEVLDDSPEALRQARRSADWKTARDYKESGFIYKGRIEGSNGGGLLVRFHSLVGFLPFSQLSPSHSCKDPQKTIHEIAKGLTGSDISMKVIQADEENKKLIFSEKEAVWSQFSEQVTVGDIFEARVGSVEDYGAFIHLRFPDGLYHLTGLVHVSEVSWDLVQDVRDILTEGDKVRVKVIIVDREKIRITLSIKQLEEDPLLETLDKVIPQDASAVPDSLSNSNISNIEPLPGLKTIFEELLQEDGIDDVRISRQGFEKRVVSQDLQLWLSNAPPTNQKFTLLARAGRQVQEIHLTTLLDQEGIKRALQRALERVP
ncbi:30S ribosomal protein S1 homolog B isoform X1 [Fagus crenata]